jgi:heat shock protein HslJ
MRKINIIILIAVLLLSACSIDLSSKEIPDLDGTSWMMIKLNDKDALTSTQVTLSFDGDEVAGSGGCNRYGGGVTWDMDGNMEFGMLFSTRMYCEKDGISDQESEYLKALDEVSTFYLSGENLFMANAGGETILEFTPMEITTEQ